LFFNDICGKNNNRHVIEQGCTGPRVKGSAMAAPIVTAESAQVVQLPTLAEEILAEARSSNAGRAARTLTPGAGLLLKQTLFALEEGVTLTEHNCPPAATLQVLHGRVCLIAGEDHIELETGDLTPVPPAKHTLRCLDDAVVLISVAGQTHQ
jgi:quercetin dioxygenase-like cupin family protein